MERKMAEKRLSRQFGENLRSRRKELGFTQDELAGMIGANRRFISELERGKGTSYLGLALMAAEALGVNIPNAFDERRRSSSPRIPEV